MIRTIILSIISVVSAIVAVWCICLIFSGEQRPEKPGWEHRAVIAACEAACANTDAYGDDMPLIQGCDMILGAEGSYECFSGELEDGK